MVDVSCLTVGRLENEAVGAKAKCPTFQRCHIEMWLSLSSSM